MGNGGTSGTLGTGAVTDNATLAFNRSDALNVANAISGTGSLTQSGAGGLTLGGADAYTGGTTLAAGALGAGNDTALGTGSLSVTGNAMFFAAGADHTLGNAVSLASSKTLTVGTDPSGAHNLMLNGTISGAGGLTINASGTTVTLGGSTANTFTGLTSVTAGTLALNKPYNTSAFGGDLSIGNPGAAPAAGTPATAVVTLIKGLQSPYPSNATIYADGLLIANSTTYTEFNNLTMTGGEVRIPSGGVLYLDGSVAINASATGSRITSTYFSNYVDLQNVAHTFTVARGTATYDLDMQVGNANGTLAKNGTGILRLAGTTNDKLSVTLNSGTLAVASDTALGSTAGSNAFTLAGGTVVADGADRAVANPVNVTGSATIGSSVDNTPRALTFSGATSLAVNTTLTVSNNAGTTFSGVVSGAGGIVKNGNAKLTLANAANTFTGGLTLNGGTLAIAGDGSLGGAANVVTLNVGTLQFSGSTTTARTFNLNNIVTLGTAAGTTLTFGSGTSVNGGFLSAGGTLAFADGSALSGTTTALGSTVTTAGAVSFTNATLRGAVTVGAGGTLAASNTVVSSAGSMTVNGTVNTTGLENDGVFNIPAGGKLANTGSMLVLGGGSRTYIGTQATPGGMLSTTAGTTVEVNGGLLVNNGTQTGALNVNYGSMVKGVGTFGTVNVTSGGVFSPGNSPGTATVGGMDLQSAGRYQFEINSAVAANNSPGNGADLINDTGTLTLSAGTTANSRFIVAVVSLDSGNNSAALTDFDASKSYKFVLVTAAGITGYSADEFAVDTSGFQNNLQGGSFAVVQDGNNLDLVYTPAPEPGTWVLLGTGGAVLLGVRRGRLPSHRWV